MAKENASLPGRAREAADNDVTVLRAAREIFAEQGWNAPVSAIATRAGVGVGSIYRRYRGKEELAQSLRAWAIDHLATLARECVSNADTDEAVLKTFFSRYLAESVGPLIPVLGGRLPEHTEVTRAAEGLEAALQSMVDICISTGEVPPDFTTADVMLMTVHLRPTLPIEGVRATEMHTRYLEFMLDVLRHGRPQPSTTPPAWSEWLQMWQGN